MLKILHLLDTLRRGGKERQFVELIRGLNKSKYQIHTIVLHKRLDGYDEEVKKISFNFEYKFRRFRWDLYLIFDLIKYCRIHKIEVVQVWDGMCAFYAYFVSLIMGIKFINYSIQEADSRLSYRNLIQRMILKLSKYVIANQYAGLKVYGVEKKGRVIYNGLDISRFSKHKTEVSGLKTEDSKQDTKISIEKNFVIGVVANLTEYKDYYTFFKAIKILQEKFKNIEVHIIGGGKLTQTYKNYSINIGVNQDILKYFGRINNVEDYIPYFDVGVLCSYKVKGEGLSNSVLEYMACGVPPVITDVGAAREIIDDGNNGLLFEAENVQDLANKIEFLMKNETIREKIGRKAKETVLEKFSYEKYIESFEEYYEMVTESKNQKKDNRKMKVEE